MDFHRENSLFFFFFLNKLQQSAGCLGTVPLAGAGGGWRETQHLSPGHWPAAGRRSLPTSPSRCLHGPLRGSTSCPRPSPERCPECPAASVSLRGRGVLLGLGWSEQETA